MMVAIQGVCDLLAKAVAGERLTPQDVCGCLSRTTWRRLAVLPTKSRGGCIRRITAPTISIATSTIQRLHRGLRFLRVLSHAEVDGRIRARAQRALSKDPRDSRPGRRSDSHAGRPAPGIQAGVVRELLRDIKSRFPQLNIHGFSPPEIYHFTKVSKLPLRTVLER